MPRRWRRNPASTPMPESAKPLIKAALAEFKAQVQVIPRAGR